MRSDRLTFISKPVGPAAGGDHVDSLVNSGWVRNLCAAAVVLTLLAGCSNAQVRRTPVTDLGEAWFCEMNESRDDWDCVQDDALASNPQPTRLPSDPVEPNPFDEEAPALPVVTTPTAGLANPSAAIDFDALAQATVRPDIITAILERPPEHFAVALATTETQALADGFIANYDLAAIEEITTLELAQDGTFYYIVLLGVFETLEEAQAAVGNLPESMADVQPWIRPVESIQTGIVDAEALRMGLGG